MLNPFPQLLFLGFFVPTLLRVAAAAAFFYLAFMQYQRRDEIVKLNLPFVGKSVWWYIISVGFNMLVGAMLLFGYYIQIASILALLSLPKGLWLNKRHPSVTILSTGTVLLLFVICLSLIISGAGAYAMDLPL